MNRWQNANTDGNIVHNGHSYQFLSFLYQGATRTRTGDNLEAGLVVSTNQIADGSAMGNALQQIRLIVNSLHLGRRVRPTQQPQLQPLLQGDPAPEPLRHTTGLTTEHIGDHPLAAKRLLDGSRRFSLKRFQHSQMSLGQIRCQRTP